MVIDIKKIKIILLLKKTVLKENKRRKVGYKNRMPRAQYEGLKKDKDTCKWGYVVKAPQTLADRECPCGNRCGIIGSDKCGCDRITDANRLELFNSYWKINWNQRRIFVASMVTCQPALRKQTANEDER